MTDYVSVKALKTFEYSGLRTKRSPPFDVEAGEAKQMKAMGLVEIAESKAKAEPELPVVPSDPERKPRKAKSDAADKDT